MLVELPDELLQAFRARQALDSGWVSSAQREKLLMDFGYFFLGPSHDVCLALVRALELPEAEEPSTTVG